MHLHTFKSVPYFITRNKKNINVTSKASNSLVGIVCFIIEIMNEHYH